MADSGGYWLNLAEAEKLTQSNLVPGVIEENIRRGGILSMLPLSQYMGLDVKWNRESAERLGQMAAVGDVLSWSDNITYTSVNRALKTIYDQTPLNKYVESVYGNMNNYRAVTLKGLRKGVIRKAEDRLIYGDLDYGTNEFDGLHAWAAENTGNLNIDGAETSLSVANLRKLIDAMKYGVDALLMPFEIARRLDAFYQEGDRGVSFTALGSMTWGPSEAGRRISFWDGVPILRSDYMGDEQKNTGAGSDARAAYTSGDKQYSIFALKFGQIREDAPGLTLAFGGPKNDPGEIFRTEFFDKLENYDAEGIRLVSYLALLSGSTMSVGRIYDITDTSITS